MHIAEGILPMRQAICWIAVAVPVVAFAAYRLEKTRRNGDIDRRALASMAAALIFAVTLFPIPVPVVGVTSHMCATPLVALLLGPLAAVVPAALTLLIQALFFAHGGLTSWGANVVTLGIVGPLAAWGLARTLRSFGCPAVLAVGIACGLADLLVYTVDAGILGVALTGKEPFSHWFRVILLGFAPIQTPLAVLEGSLSAYLFRSLALRRPNLIPVWLQGTPRKATNPMPAVALVIAVAGMLCLTTQPARAQGAFTGLDDSWSSTAAKAGRPAAKPWIDLGEGDLHTTAVASSFFLCGLIVGGAWVRLRAPRPQSRDVTLRSDQHV